MRISAIQANTVWEDRAANFELLAHPLRVAAAHGASLVVLGEMFATGFSMRTDVVAEPMDGPTMSFLRETARVHDFWVGGSFACTHDRDDLATNRFALVAPNGATHHYDKIHPFRYANEHLVYRAGTDRVAVEIDGVRCSLFVCYDLRFADEFWAVAPATDVYLIPANWPERRSHHWRSLLTARAIENQAYVVGCNRVGTADDLVYSGDSTIIDPQGRTLAHGAHTETVITADIDPDFVRETRKRFPFLADRR